MFRGIAELLVRRGRQCGNKDAGSPTTAFKITLTARPKPNLLAGRSDENARGLLPSPEFGWSRRD
jgi:hypothetical protein